MSIDPIKLSEAEALQGKDIFVGISDVDESYPLHFHEFYEIEIVISGEGEEIINGKSYQISPNRLFIFTPQDYHEIKATSPLKIFNVAFNLTHIDEETISNFLEFENTVAVDLSEHKTLQINHLLNILLEIYNSKRSNKFLILSHLLNALLLVGIGADKIQEPLLTQQKDNDVLKFIHKNFARSPSLEEISSYSGYQRNYFCEIFKQKTGVTYIHYLTQYKINYSKKLLKITNKSIKEISEECGFNSASNFIREFKKHNKITPNQYRSMYFSQINN